MKIKALFLLLTSILMGYGCLVDYVYITELIYVNNSDYNISIKCNEALSGIPKDISIPKHSSKMIYRKDSDGGYITPLSSAKTLISYDDRVRTYQTALEEIPNNFCRESSYIAENTEKRSRKYTYTFTNSDYDYAVANPYEGDDDPWVNSKGN